MNNNLKIGIAILAVAIILGSIIGAIYLGQLGNSPNPNASPNPTSTTTQSGNQAIINGAGASFPYPLLNDIISVYRNIKLNVQINYQSSGSGAGISSLKDKLVDFAASDAPLSATETASMPQALHMPETIGAVVITYNLGSETPTDLQLTGQVIADIFQGKITKWNDPAIQSLNTGVTLPNQQINVAHRSDGSGTTFIFTSYLAASSQSWNSEVGKGKSVSWPVGIGSTGNAGVAGVVKTTPYSIGYVELAYALENSMPTAKVENPAGNFVLPTTVSIEKAAQAAQGLPTGDASWTEVSLLNTADPEAYPIVSFSYLIVYKELNIVPGMTQEKATALVDFLWYVMHDGQEIAPELSYAQLPANVVSINEATIKTITFNGQTLKS